jgi:hypothetical protein
VRAKERRLMFWNAVIKTINVSMVFGVPPMVTFAVLVPYELSNAGGRTTPYVTAVTAFTMLSLFNVLRFPLVVLPKALRCVSEAINATGNLEHFMAEPAAPKHDTVGKPGVHFHNVSCTTGATGLHRAVLRLTWAISWACAAVARLHLHCCCAVGPSEPLCPHGCCSWPPAALCPTLPSCLAHHPAAC